MADRKVLKIWTFIVSEQIILGEGFLLIEYSSALNVD